MKEIKIEDWNKRKRLSKLKFKFSSIQSNFYATYFSDNSKYVIFFEFGSASTLFNEMTAMEIYEQSTTKFTLNKLY